jgi:hypothetical protein
LPLADEKIELSKFDPLNKKAEAGISSLRFFMLAEQPFVWVNKNEDFMPIINKCHKNEHQVK